MDKLPHDFDLCYDIKYPDELHREYRHAVATVLGLQRLCEAYGIRLPGTPLRKSIAGDAAATRRVLLHHLCRVTGDARLVMDEDGYTGHFQCITRHNQYLGMWEDLTDVLCQVEQLPDWDGETTDWDALGIPPFDKECEELTTTMDEVNDDSGCSGRQ